MFDGSPATELSPCHRSRQGFAWTQLGGVTVARITGGMPNEREWRAFIDHLRPSVRPIILWMSGRIWIGSEGRNELAHAIGSSRVALIANDDLGRGLATALRWLGVDISSYSSSELDQLETEFELPTGIGDRLLEQVA